MPDNPTLRLAGGLVAGAGLVLAVFIAASWFVPPLVAAAPALVVAGVVLVFAGDRPLRRRFAAIGRRFGGWIVPRDAPSAKDISIPSSVKTPDTDDLLDDSSTARIAVGLGALSVEVEAEDMDEAEAAFERVWQRALEDAEGMSKVEAAFERVWQRALEDAEGMSKAVRDGTRGYW